MNDLPFNGIRMDRLSSEIPHSEPNWLWSGYVARGDITLLTSEWKLGKTTLVAALLRAIGRGESFLGRACIQARALFVSEESRLQWAERLRSIPIGDNVQLVSRPFHYRPTLEQWGELIRYADELRRDCGMAALVIDPLAAFLPGYSECDSGALLAMLHPLRNLASKGVAVLILHHPAKRAASNGSQARGNGVLLGFVDIALELNRLSSLDVDVHRRRLRAFSRHSETPSSLVFQWSPGSSDFQVLEDLHAIRFRENWQIVAQILSKRDEVLTHRQILDEWPPENHPPCPSHLYHWLSRAVDEKLATRSGKGTRSDPYRFALPRQPASEEAEPELPLIEG